MSQDWPFKPRTQMFAKAVGETDEAAQAGQLAGGPGPDNTGYFLNLHQAFYCCASWKYPRKTGARVPHMGDF
jgi:hypothetical protein